MKQGYSQKGAVDASFFSNNTIFLTLRGCNYWPKVSTDFDPFSALLQPIYQVSAVLSTFLCCQMLPKGEISLYTVRRVC